MKYTHVLWDFNGTLLDDVESCINSINELLERHGLKKLTSLAQYQSVFGFPIIDYYKRIGFDFDKTSYDELAVEWVKLYNEYNRPLKLCPNAEKALAYLKERGVHQLILTASSVDMVKAQLSELFRQNICGEYGRGVHRACSFQSMVSGPTGLTPRGTIPVRAIWRS